MRYGILLVVNTDESPSSVVNELVSHLEFATDAAVELAVSVKESDLDKLRAALVAAPTDPACLTCGYLRVPCSEGCGELLCACNLVDHVCGKGGK